MRQHVRHVVLSSGKRLRKELTACDSFVRECFRDAWTRFSSDTCLGQFLVTSGCQSVPFVNLW